MNKNVRFSLFCLALFSARLLAADSPATATMHVSLEVVKSCTLRANDLNFSRHSSDETSDIRASTQLNITCTNGTPYRLSAQSQDGNGEGTFWLKPDETGASAQNIAYKLYADENQQTQVTSWQGIAGTGTGQEESATLYGVIEAGALVAARAGTWADDVTLNLVY